MGTLDTRTGIEKPYDPMDYITKQTGTWLAAPGTPCPPLWKKFLNTVTAGDQEVIEFLQRYMGYCITGEVSEQVFVFLLGSGQNGKGVFIRTMAGILGQYAIAAPIDLLIASKMERHPTETADLRGAYLVVCGEVPEGRRWDEGKIKSYTGGDRLKGRFMNKDFFEFEPTHKFLIAGNHMPSLRNVDDAIKRRLLVVKFPVKISEMDKDKDLEKKLKKEWPAIYRWMSDGCLKWDGIWVNGGPDGQRHPAGLMIPKSVRETSEKYFKIEDIMGQWIEENLDLDLSKETRTLELFRCWCAWCDMRRHPAGSEKRFSSDLEDRGLGRFGRSRNSTGQSVFKGVSLKPGHAVHVVVERYPTEGARGDRNDDGGVPF
jgi:putative DNA primase/helicase